MERMTDHLIFVCEFERQTYARKVGEPTAPHSLVYNGLRRAEFEPVRAAPDAADFLFVGMLRDLKGPDLFIDALALARAAAGRPLAGGDGRGRRRPAALPGAGHRAGLRRAGRVPAADAGAPGLRAGRVVVVPSRAESHALYRARSARRRHADDRHRRRRHSGDLRQGLARAGCAGRPRLGRQMAAALADPAAFRAACPSRSALRLPLRHRRDGRKDRRPSTGWRRARPAPKRCNFELQAQRFLSRPRLSSKPCSIGCQADGALP